MVRIKKIYLKNFRIHKDREIEFYDKNIILGENGTGKSSIFYGILFGLLGTKIKDAINVRSIGSLIRDFSSESKIVLEIVHNDENYIIERIIRKSGSDAILRKNDRVIATGLQNVDKEVLRILGINSPEKIIGTLYIAQGDLGKFIQNSGTKSLSETLEKIFDVHYYSFIKEVISRVHRDLSYEKNVLLDSLNEKEREINRFRKIFKGLSIEELEKLYDKLKHYRSRYEELSKIYTQIIGLKNQIDEEIIGNENEYRQLLVEINQKLEELENKMLELSSEMSRLQYDKYNKEFLDLGYEKLTSRLKELEQNVRDIDREELLFKKRYLSETLDLINKLQAYHNVEEEYNKIKQELEDTVNKISELKAIQRELYKILDLIKEKKINKCPVCNRPLDENSIVHIIEEREKELKKVNYNLRILYNKQKELETKKDNVEYRYNKFQSILTLLKERDIDINNIDVERDRIIDELKIINEKLKSLDEYEQIEHTINYIRYKELNNKITNLKKEINNLKSEKYNIERTLSKIEMMKSNIMRIRSLLTTSGYDSIDSLERDIQNLESEIKKYENIPIDSLPIYKLLLNEYNKTKEKINKLNKALSILLSLKRVLENFIMTYRRKLANDLSQVFSYYFKKIYLYDDIRDVKIEVSESRGEWKYFVYVQKYIDDKLVWREIREAGLSGGQIKILDLAFRMSIAHLIKSNLKVLMLDEPTESMDENIRMSLASLLDSLKEYQLILCTHDELFKNKINGNVILLSKN